MNKDRAASAATWPPLSRDAVDSLPSNKMPCSLERYTYKSDGEPSRFRVLHPNNRRSLAYRSSLYTSRISPQYHSRGTFRLSSSDKVLCQNCKKSLISSNQTEPSNSSLERILSPTSSASSRHDERSTDAHTETKPVLNSIKKRRTDETDKIKHVKPKRSRHVEASSLPPANHLESKAPDAPEPSASFPPIVSLSNPTNELPQTTSTPLASDVVADSPSTVVLPTPRKTPHEKSKHRDRKSSKSKRGSSSSALVTSPDRSENERSVIPPIILKLNRSDQKGSSEEPAEYKVS